MFSKYTQDKNKIKIYKQKTMLVYKCKFVLYWQRQSLWHGLAFIVNQKWKNKTFKLGKVNDRIQIIQLATFRNKSKKETEIRIEKNGFKANSRLDGKIVKKFWGGHRLNFDQLIDMYHTQN